MPCGSYHIAAVVRVLTTFTFAELQMRLISTIVYLKQKLFMDNVATKFALSCNEFFFVR